MKKELFLGVFALLVVPFLNAGCQNTASAEKDVTVSPNVLKTAEWAGFKYMDVLKQAKTRDMKAIGQFLDFHGTVDGVDALDHAVTCLELIPVAGDFEVATAIQRGKPKLREVLLERLVLAQGRTKKTELQQPLAQWAPDVWAALNGQPLPNVPEASLTKPESGGGPGGSVLDPAQADPSRMDPPADAKPADAMPTEAKPADAKPTATPADQNTPTPQPKPAQKPRQ